MPKNKNSEPFFTEDGDCLYFADDLSTVECPENFYQTRTCETELINSHIKGKVNIRVAQRLINTTITSTGNDVSFKAYNYMKNCNITMNEGIISLSDLENVDINADFVFLSRVRIIGNGKIDIDGDIHLADSTWA
ncbi:hypothetical protein phiOC_p201 [Ochrobactrum phage vB_OspM_OC]|nr:hypothetical protein phiOC_p201 [Ochrobactrum phage vB_OspM_OC]